MVSMEGLILLALIWVIWLITYRHRQRKAIRFVLILVLVYLTVTSSFMVQFATWGLTFPLPKDRGDSVDVLVILGRGEELREDRVDEVTKIWEEKRVPRIFVSGTMDVLPIIDRLRLRGVPGEVMGGEGCSQSTEENALYTSAVLYPQGVRKIILVTDAPHMLRSFLLFRNLGFTVIPHPSPLPAQWSARQKLDAIVREYIALVDYAFTNRFRQHSLTEIENPPAEIFEKFASWQCLLKNDKQRPN